MINDFNYVAPELEGVDSSNIIELLNFLDRINANVYSFILARNGNILAEGYYKPMDENFMHRQYSCTKTYVAIAVGMLYGEGKIKLEDKLIEYFPECKRDDMDPWVANCTIEDTLMMAGPGQGNYTPTDDWGLYYFAEENKVLKPAGSIYAYDTGGTVVLNRLVEKLTGKPMLEYMRPLFDKIGVSNDIWCVQSPDGYSWGGSGVVCTTRDFAKFGELLLNMGNYKGEQLLPRDFMERATASLISNKRYNVAGSSTTAGYGYQIWKSKHGFWLNGLGGQAIFCYPDKNLMFVCNADTQTNGGFSSAHVMGDLVDYFIYERLGEKKEPGEDYEKLKEKIAFLKIKTGFGEKHSDIEKEVNGKKYILRDNAAGWKWFRLDFNGDEGSITYENARGEKTIKFAMGEYMQTTFPETHYYDRKVRTPSNREFNANTTAEWICDKLLIRTFIVDTNKGNLFIHVGFTKDLRKVGVSLVKAAEFFFDDYEGTLGGELEE